MLDIIKSYAVKNLCYLAARKMTPKGIVVHSTGANNPNLKRYVDAPEEVGVNQYGNHWNTAEPDGRRVCVHAFIGYDKNRNIRVAEILPLDICCWGVGSGSKGSYNYDPAYIQFEICEDGLTDRSYYQKAFAAAAEYCTLLCRTYGFGVDKIVSHAEAYRKGYGSNHGDPEHWMKRFGETMDDFRKQVAALLNGEEVKQTAGVSPEIAPGDLVSIAQNAVYYNGKAMPDWVKKQNWYVKSCSGDRIVVDLNEAYTEAICSPIHKKYLTPVSAKAAIGGCPYLVKITADSLNIRKGAGSNTAKAGCITDHGVYTIVEEASGVGASKWGRLKSGAGWISLDYVKKL